MRITESMVNKKVEELNNKFYNELGDFEFRYSKSNRISKLYMIDVETNFIDENFTIPDDMTSREIYYFISGILLSNNLQSNMIRFVRNEK